MQNGDKALLDIILVGRDILVKMLTTFEQHHIFYQILYTYNFFSKFAGK